MLLGYREWAIIPLVVLVMASFLTSRPHLFAVFAIVLTVTISWNWLLGVARRISSMAKKTPAIGFKITTSDLRADWFILLFGPILKMKVFRQAQDMMEEKLKSDIWHSGTTENPRLLGVKSVLYPLIAAIILVPAGILVYFLYSQALIGIVFVPAFVAVFYFVMLKIRTADRKSTIEDELAPFATAASIMESINTSLFSTLAGMADAPSNILPTMRREGMRIKNLTALGTSPTDAMMDLADSHPNVSFRDFLEGYVSSFNTGGADTARYLQEQARRFFASMQFRMVQYTKQSDLMAQVILTVMLLLPMMGLSMMFFSSGSLAGTMMLLLTVMLPLITVVMIGMVQLRQPKDMDRIETPWMPFVAGIICAILVYLTRDSAWEAIGSGVVATSFLNMLLVGGRFRETIQAEAPLPEFMRQMTRFKNIGRDIMYGIKCMYEEIVQRQHTGKSPRFNHTFDAHIVQIYKKMSSGRSLEWAVSRTRITAHNARLVFFILGKVHESGGGTAKTLDDVTRWITQYADSKKEMVANLRASLFTAFIGPVLMVMMSVVSDRLIAEFDGKGAAQLGSLAFNIAPGAGLAGLSEILTITAVACMGVVLSKINYFTVRHTTFTGIITAVTMVLLYARPYFPDFGP